MIRAVGLWLFGTWRGRKWLAAGAVVVGLLFSLGRVDFSSQAEHKGTWSGLNNHIAPDKGTLSLHRTAGNSATCTVRGKTGVAIGNGWTFKGEATVAETSCEGRIEKDGKVSLALALKLEWAGRIKGIGGDWEDIDGKATCEGDLSGSLAAGGKWEAKCKNDSAEWEASFDWKPDAD